MEEFTSEGTERRSPSTELLQRGFRYALSLTHHAQDAEDLVQDAWLKLTRNYGEVSSRNVLFVAIRNGFIDLLRRRKGRDFVSIDDLRPEATGTALERGGAADLETILQQLRPVEREVLYLHHVEGYTAEEVGQITAVPRNTVLSMLSRAMKKLQVVQKD